MAKSEEDSVREMSDITQPRIQREQVAADSSTLKTGDMILRNVCSHKNYRQFFHRHIDIIFVGKFHEMCSRGRLRRKVKLSLCLTN
jgi:hypothetical protein